MYTTDHNPLGNRWDGDSAVIISQCLLRPTAPRQPLIQLNIESLPKQGQIPMVPLMKIAARHNGSFVPEWMIYKLTGNHGDRPEKKGRTRHSLHLYHNIPLGILQRWNRFGMTAYRYIHEGQIIKTTSNMNSSLQKVPETMYCTAL